MVVRIPASIQDGAVSSSVVLLQSPRVREVSRHGPNRSASPFAASSDRSEAPGRGVNISKYWKHHLSRLLVRMIVISDA